MSLTKVVVIAGTRVDVEVGARTSTLEKHVREHLSLNLCTRSHTRQRHGALSFKLSLRVSVKRHATWSKVRSKSQSRYVWRVLVVKCQFVDHRASTPTLLVGFTPMSFSLVTHVLVVLPVFPLLYRGSGLTSKKHS